MKKESAFDKSAQGNGPQPKHDTKTLKELFQEELADMYDAEQRIVRALPKLAKAAASAGLQRVFQSHLRETEDHVKKLERVFQSFGEKAQRNRCEATVGFLEEGEEIASEYMGAHAIDAALISAAQRAERYGMASYGCLHEWATRLGNNQAANLLKEILEEEQATDEKLEELALTL